jgi:hypothetical protein
MNSTNTNNDNKTTDLSETFLLDQEAARMAQELNNKFFALHPQSSAFWIQDAMLNQFSIDQPDGNSENGNSENENSENGKDDNDILKLCPACIESSVNYEGIMPPLTRQKCISSDEWINSLTQAQIDAFKEPIMSGVHVHVHVDTDIQPLDAIESTMYRCWHRVDYTQECDKCRLVLLALPPLTRLKAFHGDNSDLDTRFECTETEEFVINVVLEDDGAEKRPTEEEDEYGPIDPDDLVYDPALSVVENQYRRNLHDLKELYEYHPWHLTEALALRGKIKEYEDKK